MREQVSFNFSGACRKASLFNMKDIYIVHVGNYIGAYRCGTCPTIVYAPAEKFIDFIQSIREDYPEYRLRCVRNWGIEEEVMKVIDRDKILQLFNNLKNR